MRFFLSALLALAAAFAGNALAQDVPGRVGRVSALEGTAALYQDPDRGWEDAYVNAPFTSRNSVWTDPDSRAELAVGPIALRLDEESQLDVSSLDDATLDATLERGSLAARLRHFRPGNVVRLSTPQASFLLQSEGRYRLDSDPDRGESRLSVFAGTAGLQTAGGRIRVSAGQSVVVWDDDGARYAFQDVSETEIDRWARARDARWVERRAPEFVSYEMTGYEDLDAYGEWDQDPVYGAVWFPTRVQEDWAPYRYGRWAFVRPWGWTWVDAEPWGYAPFHYGRWVHVRDRWAWCPGRRVDRPAWAPALVGFIGGGDWSARASSGGPVVGWFPLAPSEPYRPWYKASKTYVTRVNAAVRNVPAAVSRPHVEWNRDRGATVVHRDVLAAGRPVQQSRVNMPADVVRRAPVAAAPLDILPSRDEAHRAQRNAPARSAPAGGNALARPASPGAPAAPAAAANPLARPSFTKPPAPPRAATRGAAPPPAPPAARPNPVAAPSPAPSAAVPRPGETRPREEPQRRGQDTQRQRAAGEAQQREAQQREAQQREAQQREAQQREAQQREAQQRAAQEQQRERGDAEKQRAREAQQQERAAREAQQQQRQQEERAAREAQQRDRAAAEAAQQRERQAQEQQRAAREAAQQRERQAQEQQRAAREAAQQQQKAAQEQQRAAREAAQQQQKAAEEQQRAAREAAQQQQKAAEAQQRAAQEQQRRAAEAQKAEPPKAEPPKAEPQKAEPRRGPPPGRGPPEEREKREDEGKRGRGEGG